MLEMTKEDVSFINTDLYGSGALGRMNRLSKHNKEWDINDFELLSGWHYCKTDKDTGMPMIFTDFITGVSVNKKGFRFELLDKDMNPIIMECIFKNATGKAKKSGATAMLKIWMRKDRNE